ncbi:MAG: RND transporter, partial [Mesorhizobium sp.]
MTGFERGLVAARRMIVPIFTAVLLAGCVVGPDYQKPLLPMPANWTGQKPAKAARPAQLSKWWQRLRDPELNTLVEEAVAGNLDVATARARIREARASYRQSAGTL